MKFIMKEKSKNQNYDIIGDIHGCAAELECLLNQLGYREVGTSFVHPEGRQAVFLGDYLDRGPEILRTLQIVRGMIEKGTALGILGNHEVNALRYHNVGQDGNYLRPHTDHNTKQHSAVLNQLADPYPLEWREWLYWLGGLPLWLDLGGIRVVHAAWHTGIMEELSPRLDRLEGETLRTLSRKKTRDYDAVSFVMNGPEAELPDGYFFRSYDGKKRFEIRTEWWQALQGRTALDIAFQGNLPGIPDLPPKAYPDIEIHTPDKPITFFGHYALKNGSPEPILQNLACLDYGAAKGGQIGAYRWDGESILDPNKFFLSPTTEEF